MSEKTWIFHDRSKWPSGEWDNEPDKVQWIDEATGLDCLAHRNRSGAWCGYVGVQEGHPYYGIDYSGCALPVKCGESYCGHSPGCHINVHGGLTYSDFCQETEHEGRGICHVAEPGRPEKVWWLGFDCAHSGDVIPAYDWSHGWESHYCSLGYVKRECETLAAQLVERVNPRA